MCRGAGTLYLKDRVEWFDNLLRDTQVRVRQIVKNPAFALTAIFVLALGYRRERCHFRFVEAALLEPLPYANRNG